MKREFYRILVLLSGGWLAVSAAGCNDPVAAERITRRQDNLHKTVGMLNDVEATRPRALAWAADRLRDQHERDLRNAAENPSRIDQLIQEDIDDWQRLESFFIDTAREKLEGDPDTIRRTLPQMAW